MRQRWTDLLFLHWPIDPTQIQPHLPDGLLVDTFDGSAYIALVPFKMWDIHPTGTVPVPGVSNLLECNVRTYVRQENGDAPGVWFFSLDASNLIAVAVARSIWRLPYFFAAMGQFESRLRDEKGRWTRRISYSSTRRHPGATTGGCAVRYEPFGQIRTAQTGSLEEFMIERYTLYSNKNGVLYSGRVQHMPYQFQAARLLKLDESLIAAAGIERPEEAPIVHYARNVVVDIYPLRSVAGIESAPQYVTPRLTGQPA